MEMLWNNPLYSLFKKKKDFIYLFLERGKGERKKERERNIGRLPLA